MRQNIKTGALANAVNATGLNLCTQTFFQMNTVVKFIYPPRFLINQLIPSCQVCERRAYHNFLFFNFLRTFQSSKNELFFSEVQNYLLF